MAKVLKGDKRTLTERFMHFKEHYSFTAAFCNIGAGHEKENVKAKVGYHRRNMLVPIPKIDSLIKSFLPGVKKTVTGAITGWIPLIMSCLKKISHLF